MLAHIRILQLLDMVSVHTLQIRDLQLSSPGTSDTIKEKQEHDKQSSWLLPALQRFGFLL